MRKIIIFLLFYNLSYNYSFSQGRLSFVEEDLTFELTDSVFIVKGLYFFESSEEREYLIVYPFPTDSIYGNPFDINVININVADTLTYKIADNNSSITFTAKISNQTQLYVTYSQSLKSNKAKYILTTTSSWKKPLERAEYKLLTDKKLIISNFSMNPDNKIIVDGKNLYVWQKEKYIPETDFEIQFE